MPEIFRDKRSERGRASQARPCDSVHSHHEWNIPSAGSVIRGDQRVRSTTLSLLQGTVDLLILKALQNGPGHGYTVSRFVRERTDGVLQMEDAALYQALHRLEHKGWIAAEWGLSENNRRAKYYGLTVAGTRQLREEVAAFTRYAAAIFKVIETT
jgi:PadR family transcriptional regulator PadR